MLTGKNILVAVTGSIAAYKAAFLVRGLVKEGANVKVIMTKSATSFITPLTLATLSKNPVVSSYCDDEQTGVWNNHVELGLWADILLIAPASANTLGKMAHGVCDNVLLATYLSAKCPVFVAPAMDLDMYQHPTTKANLDLLNSYGNVIIPSDYGELASGLTGQGRMAEPEHLITVIGDYGRKSKELIGKQVLISAGPTYEQIDPVRFIGNHSSGKMGYALAEEAFSRGAQVTLVSGPTSLSCNPGINRIDVTGAEEMAQAVFAHFENCDVAIMSAAVSDYTPRTTASEKIKKKDASMVVELKPTTDILSTLGEQKKNQLLVGFALETEHEEEHAKGKLARKNCDFIVLNSLREAGAGFGKDTNRVVIYSKDNKKYPFELKSKAEVALDIWNTVLA